MLLPLLLYFCFIIFYLHGSRDLASFGTIASLNNLSFQQVMTAVFGWFSSHGMNAAGVLYNTFYEIFNNVDILGFIDGADISMICWYASYLILVELLHICVDVILLLPRLCRKLFTDKFRSED